MYTNNVLGVSKLIGVLVNLTVFVPTILQVFLFKDLSSKLKVRILYLVIPSIHFLLLILFYALLNGNSLIKPETAELIIAGGLIGFFHLYFRFVGDAPGSALDHDIKILYQGKNL